MKSREVCNDLPLTLKIFFRKPSFACKALRKYNIPNRPITHTPSKKTGNEQWAGNVQHTRDVQKILLIFSD